jgi:hypothetical protein
MPSSKVELCAAIRRDARAGMSGRAIERKYRVGRRTIVSALASAWPELRKPLPARPSKLDPFKPAIDEILKADLEAPRKQRHTITRIQARTLSSVLAGNLATSNYSLRTSLCGDREESSWTERVGWGTCRKPLFARTGTVI